MADNNMNTQNTGFKKMDEKAKHDIQSKGGKASVKSEGRSAGSTDAAKLGGEHSHTNNR